MNQWTNRLKEDGEKNIRINNVDWNMYEGVFPGKYWKEGWVDEKIKRWVKDSWEKTVKGSPQRWLDVAGGVSGTKALREQWHSELNVDLHYVDPFVEDLKGPAWKGRVHWGSIGVNCWDGMVCRGAINYLSDEELMELSQGLKDGALLMFNTFLTGPSEAWNERSCYSPLYGEGVERSRGKHGKVEHELVFKNKTIRHSFWIRSMDDWNRFFKVNEVESYGHNSMCLKVTKKLMK